MARKRTRTVDAGAESIDTSEKYDSSGNCPHIAKGVDIGTLKKSWKKRDEANCQACKKKTPSSNKKGSTAEQDLWVCMRCGHIGCGNSRQSHGRDHFLTPHSDCHAVVAVVDTWTVRCIQCRNEINLELSGKAFDAVEFLKKNFMGTLKEEKDDVEDATVPICEEKKQGKRSPVLQDVKSKTASSFGAHRVMPVLGLENIGNTCYMNAVLQCLAQTPGLDSELESTNQSGGFFKLPGGEHLISKEHGEYLPPLEGKLGETGQLTKAVSKVVIKVKNGEKLRKTGVTNENPGDILRLMKKLSNTFYVGEQHDSHELLRLLLEGLRTEDLKRYQRGILNTMGICSAAREVLPKEREFLIAYKKQAAQNELSIDKLFGGSLVSILKCLECGSVTTNVESFMDISLPVESEKPKTFERPTVTAENRLSKHQLKKERKLARRVKKKPKLSRAPDASHQIENKARSSSETASDSEADVEDNVDYENAASSAQEEVPKTEIASDPITGITNRLNACDFSSFASDNSNIDAAPGEVTYPLSPEETTVYGPDSQEVVYRSSPELGTVVYGCSPDPGTVVHGCSPEPGTVIHSCSPEQETVIYSCSPEPETETYGGSPEPSILEDFGSCEGGRGSPASSIEQADWEEEANSRADYNVLVKGVEKALQLSQDPCLVPDSLTDNNLKERQWVDSSKEEIMSIDSPFEGLSSRLDPISSDSSLKAVVNLDDEDNEKFDDACNSLDDDQGKDNERYDVECDKQGLSDETYNELTDNKKGLVDEITSNPAFVDLNNVDSDSSIWDATLAPLAEIDEKVYSIFNCLNQFFSKEVLCDANQIGCLRCTRLKSGMEPKPNTKLILANALKQLLFLKLPKVLTIHLKRFEVLGTRMCKITRKVSFPFVLDISPYTSRRTLSTQPDTPAMYELYAVVEHSGHMSSGHYVAYINVSPNVSNLSDRIDSCPTAEKHDDKEGNNQKTTEGKSCQKYKDNPATKWYLVSDTLVREVSLKEVSNAEAYLLFYKKLE